ncbi:class I SAM-dependent methyltransferase [Candidatus Micrarchaeota archaeon]|nr:class I SAM-dependent methyltransferase [Candidatus Micrarchaeota archaeon]
MAQLFKGSKEFYNANANRYNLFEQAIDEGKTGVPELTKFRAREREKLDAMNGNVLYIGAGTSQHLIPLAKKGSKVVALEISPHMLGLSKANLQKAGIPFQVVAGNKVRPEIEKFLESGKGVLLVHGDAKKVELPNKFDYAVSYCTLPLMGRWLGWRNVLRKMANSANNVVVSIYSKENLGELAKAYSKYGFKPTVRGGTIKVSGGFKYSVLPEKSISKAMKKWIQEIETHPMGSIYTFRKGAD